ncbi:zinc finger MYND domain-containing protein 11-like [Sitodiplosis mosellana]|uniref:zinc finger MYND domain-containing protein 11-like n=1 Tax=Sitodiplosis mosellana TaxID=263140 RepID=UPI002443D421|nr:zinc finger MYND domain-containing protein 11-like [Sitodiplosis mosellana]
MIDNVKNWRCPVCIRLESTKNSDGKERLDMLPIMINRAFNDTKFGLLKLPLDGAKSNSLVNRIDLAGIKDKTYTYTSFFEFLVDVQWIIHNCSVLFPVKHDMVKTAKSLAKYLELEIESVKKCAECYSNANKNPDTMAWFTVVCAKPHIVVWAKLEGYDYWPAKVMFVDKKLINVRFFGDRTEADVPAKKCFLYSDTNPSLKSTKPSASYRSALKEANEYIANVRKRFGVYHLVETKIPFKPTLLNRYLLDVIPGVGSFQLPSIVSEDSTASTHCSLDSHTNAMQKQTRSDAVLSTIPEDVRINEELIELTGSNQLTPPDNDGLSELNINLHTEEVNDEPIRKKSRFSNGTKEGRAEKNLVISSTIENPETSTIEVPADSEIPVGQPSSKMGCDVMVVNDAESSSASLTWNLDKCQEIMESTKSSSKAFDYLCDVNAKLQNKMKNVAAEHNRKIKLLEDLNVQLTDELKKKNYGLAAEKSEYNKMVARKDKEKMDAVNEAKKQYDADLEASKKKIFCMACDTAKPQDTFYFCNAKCQEDYWMKWDK